VTETNGLKAGLCWYRMAGLFGLREYPRAVSYADKGRLSNYHFIPIWKLLDLNTGQFQMLQLSARLVTILRQLSGPMMPRKALPILISNLRPFSFNQIPSFTTIEPNLYLVIIENVESPPKSIFQTCHATLRMENFPWFDACFAFAGL